MIYYRQQRYRLLRRKNETHADIDLARWRVGDFLFYERNKVIFAFTRNVCGASALNIVKEHSVHVILYHVTSF